MCGVLPVSQAMPTEVGVAPSRSAPATSGSASTRVPATSSPVPSTDGSVAPAAVPKTATNTGDTSPNPSGMLSTGCIESFTGTPASPAALMTWLGPSGIWLTMSTNAEFTEWVVASCIVIGPNDSPPALRIGLFAPRGVKLVPLNVSDSEKPCRRAAMSAYGLNVEPVGRGVVAQLRPLR